MSNTDNRCRLVLIVPDIADVDSRVQILSGALRGGDVASVIFERIEAGDWELGDLATQLSDAAASRHLLVGHAGGLGGGQWQHQGCGGGESGNKVAWGHAGLQSGCSVTG